MSPLLPDLNAGKKHTPNRRCVNPKTLLEGDIFYFLVGDVISLSFTDEGIFLYHKFISQDKKPVLIKPHTSPERLCFSQDNIIVWSEIDTFKKISLGEPVH